MVYKRGLVSTFYETKINRAEVEGVRSLETSVVYIGFGREKVTFFRFFERVR